MKQRIDIPPTAGLPLQWRDFLPAKNNFAESISAALSIPKPLLTCSGTSALIIILKTFAKSSLRKNVIIPAYSCPLVALAIAHCGLNIQLSDLAENTIDFDSGQLAQLADENTLAIIPTHLGGRVADVATAHKIAKRVGAFVIEDAAQALGAQAEKNSVGLSGDAGFFSMAVGKGLTTFEGGVLFSNDAQLQKKFAETAAELLPQDFFWELRRSIELTAYYTVYNPAALYYAYGKGYRKSLSNNNWVEAVGDDFSEKIPLHSLGQWRQARASNALERLPTFLQSTREQALRRVQQLQELKNIVVLTNNAGDTGVWPFLMVIMPTQEARDKALEILTPSGLGVSRLFIHALNDYDYLKPVFKKHSGKITPTPNARKFSEKMLTISNSLWLDDEKFSTIFDVLSAVSGNCG